MKGLQKKTLRQTEVEYLTLVAEVLYYLNQPDIKEDPAAQALALETRDLLEEISLSKDLDLAEEVQQNLLQLWSRVAEAMLRWVALDYGTPLVSRAEQHEPTLAPNKAAARRKKWKNRGGADTNSACFVTANTQTHIKQAWGSQRRVSQHLAPGAVG